MAARRLVPGRQAKSRSVVVANVAGKTKAKTAAVRPKVKVVAAKKTKRGKAVEVLESSSSGSSSDDSESEEEQLVVRQPGSMPLVPRKAHVDDKARDKIRRGEYVDFKFLVARPRGEEPRKKFAFSEGLFEEVEDSSNLVFYDWVDAFLVFMSVRLEFYPDEAQGLLRHMQIVKNIHGSGKDGVEYDFQFRRLKGQHKDIRWGEYLAELAVEMKDRRLPAPKRVERPRATGRFGFQPASRLGQQKGVCFKFNSPEGCKYLSCRFSHKCRKCSGDHPGCRCKK